MKYTMSRSIYPHEVYANRTLVAESIRHAGAQIVDFRPVRKGDLFLSTGKSIFCEFYNTVLAEGDYAGVSPRFILTSIPPVKGDWWE